MSTAPTVQIDFTGYVSSESAAGETVTVTTKHADGTAGPTATGLSVDDGKGNSVPILNADGTVKTPASITFLTSKVSLVPGEKGMVANATVPDDSVDAKATSPDFKFDVPLVARTIMITGALQ